MVYLLTLLSFSLIQVEEFRFPECVCRISGVDEWDTGIVCRQICASKDEELEATRLQEKIVHVFEELYRSAGFLDVEFDCQVRRDDEGGAELSITVNEGPKYVVGKIQIEFEGAELDRESLREQLIISPGKPCNQQLAEVSRIRIMVFSRRLLHLESWDMKMVELEYIKDPESGVVDLRYVVKIQAD